MPLILQLSLIFILRFSILIHINFFFIQPDILFIFYPNLLFLIMFIFQDILKLQIFLLLIHFQIFLQIPYLYYQIFITKIMSKYPIVFQMNILINLSAEQMWKNGAIAILVSLLAYLSTSQLIKFDLQVHVDVLKQNHPSIFFLMNDNETIYESQKIYEQVSEQMKQIIFFSSRRNHCELYYKLHDFFGTYQISDPVIIFFSEGKKYYYQTLNMTKQSLKEFLIQAQAKKIPIYYKNQVLPVNNSGPVFSYNAKLFKQEVIVSSQQYVVKFYSPWCQYSLHLAPRFLQASKKMGKINPDIKFVEIDITKNQIAQIPVKETPTIYFFQQDKYEAVVKFNQDREVDLIVDWVNTVAQSSSSPRMQETEL